MKTDSITFKQLRALRAVAESGSITAAADTLGLTAPAVHTQLRLLEENAGCKLLRRGGAGGGRLTPEGEALLEADHTIRAALDGAARRIRALRDGQSGVVVLGVVSTAKYFAPGLVAALQRAHPGIDVLLRVGNRDVTITALQQQTIDLAIMGRPPRTPPCIVTSIGAHPHVMIAASGHPLAGGGRIAPADLLDQLFISREEGSGTRILMTRYLDRIGEGAPYRMIEMGTNETIKQAVMAGLGIALISQHTVTEELNAGRLVALDAEGMPIIRQWYLLHRTDLHMTPAIRVVHDFIAAQKGRFLPRLCGAAAPSGAGAGTGALLSDDGIDDLKRILRHQDR